MNNKDYDLMLVFILGLWTYLAFRLIPTFSIFAFGGIEESINLSKLYLYSTFGAFIIILLYKLARYIFMDKYPLMKYIDAPVFDPENSMFYPTRENAIGKVIYKIISNPLLLICFSIIVGITFAMFAGIFQNSAIGAYFPASGIPNFGTEQQITAGAEIALAVEPASTSETSELFVFYAILFSLSSLLTLYKWKSPTAFYFSLIIISIICGFYWGLIHSARYSNLEFGFLSTFIFGLVQGLMISLTMSIIPAIIYHITNNFIQILFVKATPAIAIPIAIFIILIMALLMVIIYNISKKFEQEPTIPGLDE